jgi:hypothetical protein
MSKLTALVQSLPSVPAKMPGGVAVLGAVRDTGIVVGSWGDGFLLFRTEAVADGWVDRPLTPILTREEIRTVVEWGVLELDRRVLTWPPLHLVLSLGVLLASLPDADVDQTTDGPAPVGGGAVAMEASA